TDDELMLLAACRKWSELQLFSVSASGIIGTGKELFANASALLEGGRTDPHNSRRGHVWTRGRAPEGGWSGGRRGSPPLNDLLWRTLRVRLDQENPSDRV